MTEQLVLVDTLSDATAWRKANPYAYHQLVRWAREDVENQPEARFPCSMALYFELLRRPHFAYKLGLSRSSANVMLPNALRADLARLVMRENVDLRGRFRIAHTKNDDWPGGTRDEFYKWCDEKDPRPAAGRHLSGGVGFLVGDDGLEAFSERKSIDPTIGVFR